MHELTLIYGIADAVQKVKEENGLEHIEAVVVQVGELSGVLTEFLEEYYPLLTEDMPVLAGSELVIEKIPAIGRCNVCSEEYNIVASKGCCPSCGSMKKDVLSGKDFVMKEIRVLEE